MIRSGIQRVKFQNIQKFCNLSFELPAFSSRLIIHRLKCKLFWFFSFPFIMNLVILSNDFWSLPMSKNTKNTIESNVFLDVLAFFLSFFISIVRSISYIFWKKPEKRGIFFKSIHFVFYIWPKYFWQKPSGKKIGSFLWDSINFIFYNIPLPHEVKK